MNGFEKRCRTLTENTENTFVTPVFNGSASLRNAAGQMIENVTRSVRRKETVDDAYIDKLETALAESASRCANVEKAFIQEAIRNVEV